MSRAAFIVAMEPYILRKGFLSILSRLPGVYVLREFADDGGLDAFLKNHPHDYLLISTSLYEVVKQEIMAVDPRLERILLVDTHDDKDILPPLEAPLISASDNRERILSLIGEVIGTANPAEPRGELEALTPREQTIVRLVAMGRTNKQIADELFLSAHTVITHRKNISSKLGIKSVSGLTVYAIVNNLITIGEVSSKAGE
jgi:DNA-binding NarL/FixJ family response regulator